MKIIDVHNHVGLSRDGGHGRIEVLLESMKDLGITKSVVFATDEADRGDTYELPNARILALQKKYPKRILAFARIVPSAGKAAADEFKKCCQVGVKGLKLKTVDGFDPEESRPILDLIGHRKKFPILMHTAHDQHSQPRRWEPIVADYPHLNFILAHGGKDHYRRCAEIAIKYKNAYIETSTLSFNRTRHVYQTVGPGKLLFASDYPYSHPAIELKKFEILVKNQKDLAEIFYHNAAKLLDI